MIATFSVYYSRDLGERGKEESTVEECIWTIGELDWRVGQMKTMPNMDTYGKQAFRWIGIGLHVHVRGAWMPGYGNNDVVLIGTCCRRESGEGSSMAQWIQMRGDDVEWFGKERKCFHTQSFVHVAKAVYSVSVRQLMTVLCYCIAILYHQRVLLSLHNRYAQFPNQYPSRPLSRHGHESTTPRAGLPSEHNAIGYSDGQSRLTTRLDYWVFVRREGPPFSVHRSRVVFKPYPTPVSPSVPLDPTCRHLRFSTKRTATLLLRHHWWAGRCGGTAGHARHDGRWRLNVQKPLSHGSSPNTSDTIH